MSKFKDLTGQKFGMLTAIERIGRNKHKQSIWLCSCDCGKYKNALIGDLNSGQIKSCGCLNVLSRVESHTTHGLSKNNKLYSVWDAMKQRCNNPKNHAYNNYGGRGILVCEEWKNYQNFHNWSINSGYKHGLSIDRIDNDSGYSPDNCRWVDIKTQIRNRRLTKTIEYKGVAKPLAEWCEAIKLNYNQAYRLLLKGLSFEEVIEHINITK